MSQWFRSWHGAPTDPKWRTIARRAKVRPGDVFAVVSYLWDRASQADMRGTVEGYDIEVIADSFGYEPDEVGAIIAALIDKEVIVQGRISAWEKYQPKREDDNSTNRVKEFRARQKETQNQEKICDETHVTTVKRSETLEESRVDTDKIREENNIIARGACNPRDELPRRAADFSDLDLDNSEIESRLRKAAGLQGSNATALRDISPITDLIKRGFDFESVILPAIQSHGKRENASSWKYFVSRIEERQSSAKTFTGPAPPTVAPITNMVLIKNGSKAFDAWREYLDVTGKRARASMMRQGLVQELSVETEFPPPLPNSQKQESAA